MGILAEICRDYGENAAADLIEIRANDGDYLGAASIYKTCRRIPDGERLSRMAAPFRRTTSQVPLDLLEILVSLPVSGIVTPNYDRSLHDAYAKYQGSSALPLELSDSTLRNAALVTEFFIARIHGRAEVPQSMILDHSDYALLANNKDYTDFLVTLLRERPTLFVGFSFVDPAIDFVLKTYKENFGPNFPRMHLAIVPDDRTSQLFSALAAVNIRTVTYALDAEHKDLWRALRIGFEETSTQQLKLPLPAILPKDLPPSNLHRVIAFAYARSKTPQSAARPALEMVQDGVLLSILHDEPSSHLEKAIAVERLRELLRLDETTAHTFFAESLQRLRASGDVEELETYLRKRSTPVLILDEQLKRLSEGVVVRLSVIHGKSVDSIASVSLEGIWEELFMTRAWDLAAQYAGSVISRGLGIEECVSAICSRALPDARLFAEHLTEAFVNLITRPDGKEAEALAEISRTAIAVNVLFSSPRHTLSHAYTLPTKLYLDASVLLPAIAEGHPMQAGYNAAIKRLQRAARKAGLRCELVVGTQFLEEIVAHRQNAIELVTNSHLEDPDALASHIIYYGAERTNVFVGAFSSRYADALNERYSFVDFLDQVAPYENEQKLVEFLEQRGIAAETMDFSYRNNVEFSHVFNDLTYGYERQLWGVRRAKEAVLIKHEAQQLTRLFLDISSGKRSVFVTADTRLQRIVQGSENLEKLTGSVLSQIGFIGLVDLLVGLTPDREVFTRLMWACPRNDVQKHIRDYLVAVTLRKYDDAMARAMPEVLSDVVNAAENEISMFAHRPGDATDPEDVKETARFLDRLESQYFERMRKVLKARDQN
jgi:SIR2-like domain